MKYSLAAFPMILTAMGRGASAFQSLSRPSRGGVAALSSSAKSLVEKVLENPKWPPEWPYSDEDFRRVDETDDDIFYDSPR